MAMTIEEAGAGVLSCGVDILGSDLSERSLEKAQAGMFTQFEVQRGLPIRLLARHFEKRDELWVLSPRLRSMVRWRRVNLNAELRQLAGFDLILCRNVLSGMTAEARSRALAQLIRALAPGGFLVLGAEEALSETSSGVALLGGGVHRLDPAASVAA